MRYACNEVCLLVKYAFLVINCPNFLKGMLFELRKLSLH